MSVPLVPDGPMTIGPQFTPMIEAFTVLLNTLMGMMPQDPFAETITGLEEFFHSEPATLYMDWLNWFLPVSWIIGVISAWLGCILVIYSVMIIARFIGILSK